MAWYKEWFGEDYLDLYAHRDTEEAERNVDFVAATLGAPQPPPVLDLACGAGRHTLALTRRGLRALGVDLSLVLLARRPPKPGVAGDMRRLPFRAATFGWVLNFFTSFGYFERERENFQVLEEIARVLAPGGRFLIDFLNRDRVLERLEPREVRETERGRVEIERWYDAGTRRINKRMRLATPGRPPRTYLESVRAYSQGEVIDGISWVGLHLDALYGNFQGEPFTRDSERLILVGHRPA